MWCKKASHISYLYKENDSKILEMLLLYLLCLAHWTWGKESKFEKIISFAQDLGNGQIVTELPQLVMGRIVNTIVENFVPTPPRWFAGTKDTLSSAVLDWRTRYAILLDPHWTNQQCDVEGCQSESATLPSSEDIFKKLFLRENFKEAPFGANMLLVCWANWFLDELFRTEPNTNGTLFRKVSNPTASVEGNFGSTTISLKQLYGTDSAREKALRSFQNGKLLVRDRPSTDGKESLPSITQLRSGASPERQQFTILCGWDRGDQSCWNNTDYYATGHERFNFHPGHLFMSHIFMREHNRVCDELARENPDWDDERLYQTARVLMIHITIKNILEVYVSEGIAGFRNVARLKYDPDLLRDLQYQTLTPHMFLEFNHLYRWHGLVAEKLDFQSDKEPFFNFLWKPAKFEARSVPELAAAFHRTSAGVLGPRNTPYYLRNITVSTIEDGRANQLRSFNDYREHFGLSRYTSFADFKNTKEVTATLESLYSSVDDIDFFVGLMVESRYEEGNFLPQTVVYTVAAFAFSAILNSPAIRNPHLFSEKGLSAWGLNYAKETSFADLISRHAGNDFYCNMFIRDEFAYCDKVSYPTEWAIENIIDYIGQDEMFDSFLTSGTFLPYLLYVVLALFGAFFFVHYGLMIFWPAYVKMDSFEKYRITFASVNVVLLTATTVPYTYYVLELLFGPVFFDSVQSNFKRIISFVMLHGIMYIIEVCSRLVYASTSWMLLFHHTMWWILLLLAAVPRSIFVFKTDFILDVCVSYELGLFVALLARKVTNNYKWRCRLIIIGCLYYFLTRIVQAICLFYLFAVSGPRMLTQGDGVDIFLYIFTVAGSICLLLMQLHTFIIFFILYNSDYNKMLAEKQKGSIPELDETSSDSTKVPLESTPQIPKVQPEPTAPLSHGSDDSPTGPRTPVVPLLVLPPQIVEDTPPPSERREPHPHFNHGRRTARLSLQLPNPTQRTQRVGSHRAQANPLSPRLPASPRGGVSNFLIGALSGFEIEDDGASPFSFTLLKKSENLNDEDSF